MTTAEIRSRFLKFFERNSHTIVESSSLVPQNDPTLLFTNAGMVQFKDVFLGKEKRPYKRATSSQKCVRAGGKHNDLENVGFTARHHTFFEMLGNFSFGDYFKKEAIRYAWQFITEELKLSKDILYVTVFEKDDEAAAIWHTQEGIPKDRIFRFGEKDNFWAMGDTGPCGPCSEIFVDRGEKFGCGKKSCAVGCDCDRFIEIWNLVFMQFNRDTSGNLIPLPKPSVDTGAGLERIASVLQDVETNYDTDAFQNIIAKIAEFAKKPYTRATDLAVSFRVIADHARAATFLIGDGVLPSNEGRGYVLRRIMRRAIRHGKKLGFETPFLSNTCGFVIDQMETPYPDLKDKRAFIEKVVQAEEEQFLKTLERGLSLLDDEVRKLGSRKMLPGEVAFKLYDTYGFPLDLTRVISAENGLTIDEVGFEREMNRQRSESRKHWKGTGQETIDATYLGLASDLKNRNKVPVFIGYDNKKHRSQCLALLVQNDDGLKAVDSFSSPSIAETGDSREKSSIVEALFSQTPFYGESGGQVGDHGRVIGAEFEGEVIDVQKPVPDLIVAHIRPINGTITVGEEYEQETDHEIRSLTEKNHTATHILHWALREVLGKHVKQAGSLVGPDGLRFDFAHFKAMTDDEVLRVENMVNEKIWHGYQIEKSEMPKDKAISTGAIAFFGEKYGDRVRVVRVGDFSTELCGGTHVANSADISLFKIASESGIAAGVRRITAYTSKGAFNYLRSKDHQLQVIKERMKAGSIDEVLGRLEKMATTERELKRQIEQFQAKNAGNEVDAMLSSAETLNNLTVVTSICPPDPQGVKRLREISDIVKQKNPQAVAVLGMVDPAGDKVSLLVAVGPQAIKRANANEILKKLLPIIDGRGGGKPDLAQAGGTNVSALEKALNEAKKLVRALPA